MSNLTYNIRLSTQSKEEYNLLLKTLLVHIVSQEKEPQQEKLFKEQKLEKSTKSSSVRDVKNHPFLQGTSSL